MQEETQTLVNEAVFLYPVEMPLTEKEIIAYADELTALDTKEKEVILRHDGEKGQYKSEVKAIGQKQERILHLLKVKKEMKQIECYNEFDYFNGIVETRRVDTNESVTTRKMTAEEYQQNLKFDSETEN
jgi:hypothetical protein